jgi:hypothetical protein
MPRLIEPDSELVVLYVPEPTAAALAEVQRSIESLRRHERSLPVYVYVADSFKGPVAQLETISGVTVRVGASLPALGTIYRRWIAISALAGARILYVNERFVFIDSPKQLLARLRHRDFYAPRLPQDSASLVEDRAGYMERSLMEPCIEQDLLTAMANVAALSPAPIHSIDIMLLNERAVRRIASRLGALRRLVRRLGRRGFSLSSRDRAQVDVALSALACAGVAKLDGGDPKDRLAEVLTAAPRLRAPRLAAVDRSGTCIVTTLRAPGPSVESFVRYHRRIGFDHIFLFFDDPLDPDRERVRGIDGVTAIPCDEQLRAEQRHLKKYSVMSRFMEKEVMARQILNVESAINRARDLGMKWILHIDVDEAFYSPSRSVAEHFADLERRGLNAATFLNLEAVPERFDIEDCFREVTLFKVNPYRLSAPAIKASAWSRMGFFMGYQRGKAAARLESDLCVEDVHRFRFAQRETRSATFWQPAILHYFDCGAAQFQRKYELLANSPEVHWGVNRKHWLELTARRFLSQGPEAMRELYRVTVMLDEPELVRRGLARGTLVRIANVARLVPTDPPPASQIH